MKKRNNWLVLVFVLMSELVFGQAVKGYIPYYRTTTQMDNTIQWNKLTDVIYFSAVISNANGAVTIQEPAKFEHVKTRAAQNGLRTYLAIGGWGLSQNFPQVAANATARQTFANNLVALCNTHNLAGIDIDWEFPSAGDKANTALLLQAIRQAFDASGKDLKLSLAVGAEQSHANNWASTAFQHIDFLNIMAYDGPTGGGQNHASMQFMQNSMTIYNTAGCPYSKMVVGVPFYGRCGGEASYADISAPNPAVAFMTDNFNNFCYNGKPTLEAKVDYVMATRGGSGIMIWEVTHDRKDQYSLLSVLATKMDQYACSVPQPNLGDARSICGSSSITLNSGVSQASGRTFTWKRGTTTLVNASSTATTYSATQAGTYEVTVTQGGCSRSAQVQITGTLPAVNLGPAINLCDPATATLDAGVTGNGISYQWRKDGTNIQGATSRTYTANTAGNYSVTVNATGCSSVSGSVTVTSALPTANNVILCSAGVANLSVSGSAGPYDWYTTQTGGSKIHTGTNYSPTVNSNTTYYVASSGGVQTSTIGKNDLSSNGWYASAQNYGQRIEVLSALTINSVKLNAQGAGNVRFRAYKMDGSLQAETPNRSVNAGNNTVNVSMNLPVGVYYFTAFGSNVNLFIDQTSAGAFEISGAIKMDATAFVNWGSGFGASTMYGHFAAINVTAGSSCARIPVTATINPSSQNCQATCTTPTSVNITANGATTFCQGGSVQLTATASPSFAYQYELFRNGTRIQGPVSTNNFTVNSSGSYTIRAFDPAGATTCTRTSAATTVTVNAKPSTPTAGSNSAICAGTTLNLTSNAISGATYAWTGPNGYTASVQNPNRTSATTAMSGTYSVRAMVNGCQSDAGTVSVTVNAKPSTPTAGSNSALCAGTTLNLTSNAISGATYAWTGPNGYTASVQNPNRTSATTAMSGTYSVRATVNGCQSDAGTVNVTVNAKPATPTASNNGPIELGQIAQLSANSISGASYAWTGPNGFTANNRNTSFTSNNLNQSGTYSVRATVNGCQSDMATTNLIINEPAVLSQVNISSPETNDVFPNGTTIPLTVEIISGSSSITQVVYTITNISTGGSIQFTAQTSPYSSQWTNAELGDYEIKATVYHVDNTTSISSIVRVNITINVNVEEELAEGRFEIYPNPFARNLELTLRNTFDNVSITIYDITGKIVATRNISPKSNKIQIEGEDLNAGIYLLEFIQGEYREIKRVVKQ